MPRALAYFAAFTGMGALLAGTLLLAVIVVGDEGMFGVVTSLIVVAE